ncbi:MAG: replication-associated recombination protein A [Pseudomonadales bacterium]|nr:replication-associated recombination protein A [Pseudomonadales bacterium]
MQKSLLPEVSAQKLNAPLAERMRPEKLDDIFGQRHLLGPGKPLRILVEKGQLHSMLLWGPPGTGKTTLAEVMSSAANTEFIALSAVLAGVKDIRLAIEEAQHALHAGKKTVLFVDEVHRFNKAQQDAFLPHVEKGTVIFIGATTENPSFEVNNALLSRTRVYLLKSLSSEDLSSVLEKALTDKRGLQENRLNFTETAREALLFLADGDARRLLNLLELCAQLSEVGSEIDEELVRAVSGSAYKRFDKGGDAFYDQISVLHKAVRGSAPDAALYWMCRMLDGGCDPFYVARRFVRMASEDIGNADPRAMQVALNAWDVLQRLGEGEGELALAQAVIYLACAPKSNASYVALSRANAHVKETGTLPVPQRFKNAPTRLMKDLGHGEGYRYAHSEPAAYAAGENYLPDDLENRNYYEPVEQGLEIQIKKKLLALRKLDERAR